MKATIWIVIIDNGDGSSSSMVFNTLKDAKEELRVQNLYSEKVYEEYDCIKEKRLIFNEVGFLLNPDKGLEVY